MNRYMIDSLLIMNINYLMNINDYYFFINLVLYFQSDDYEYQIISGKCIF